MITYPKRKITRPRGKGYAVGPRHAAKIRKGSKLISKNDPPCGPDGQRAHEAMMRKGSADLLAALLPELKRLERERRPRA